MKYYFVLISLLILASTVLQNVPLAQSNCLYGCYNPVIDNKYYVYSDVANVRTLPDIDSEIKFKLFAGQEIMNISYKENSNIIDGMNGYWYFIKTIDGTNREGWIWSQTLSCMQLQKGDTRFVFGMDSGVEKYDCKLTIKAIENGKIVDRKIFESYFAMGCDSARIIDSVKLKNVEYVVHLTFNTFGCNEIGEDEFYFAWLNEKKKLVKLPKTSFYSRKSEDLHIPTKSNRGIPNILVKVTENGIGEPIWDTDSGYKWDKYEYKTELFKWDGEKVIKIKQQ